MFSVFGLGLFLAGGALFAQAPAKKQAPAKPLDLNRATVEQLQQLPEVGPKVAQAIVRFREKAGAFRRVEELLAVPGVTRRRLEKIRPHVFVERVSAAREGGSVQGREAPAGRRRYGATGSGARPASASA